MTPPLATALAELASAIRRLLEAAPAGGRQAELEALGRQAAQLATQAQDEQSRRQEEAAHLEAILETIFAIAALDFTRKAPVQGSGPVDALALSVNMLAEELDAAQKGLREAKAAAEARAAELAEAMQRIRRLEGIIPICMHCHRIREEGNEWQRLEEYISSHSDARFSHGLCPDCKARHYPQAGD